MEEFKEYIWKCTQWTLGRFTEAQLLMVVVFGLFVLLGVGGVGFALWQRAWAWLLALVPLGALMLILAPFFIWRAERRKVTEYETQVLDLVVEDNNQYLQERGGIWILRVGIKTSGGRSVNNVEVTLTHIDGKESLHADAPLRPAYCLPDEPSAFTVKPGETRFAEVFSNIKGDTKMRIHYHNDYQLVLRGLSPKRTMPFLLGGEVSVGQKITLCATGDNIKSVSKDFIVSTEGQKPLLKDSSK